MALLKSVDNVDHIDYYEYRDHDFYSKYKYRAKLRFLGAQFLYYTKSVQDWCNRVTNTERSWFAERLTQSQKDEILKNQPIVEKFLIFKKSKEKNKFTIRIEGCTIAVFSNDLDLLVSLKDWDPYLTIEITECKLGEYSGVKYFVREPKNSYRVYLKSKRIASDTVVQLKDLLVRQPNLKPSKGLEKWLNHESRNVWRHRYCSASFSIDYDDESMLSYLAICHGDLLGKKYKLEKRELGN